MKQIIILVLFVMGITTSCGEDFFSSPKEFDVGEIENQVSVVARLINTDLDTLFDYNAVNNVGLLISKSKSILDQEDFTLIENAEVMLLGDDGTNISYNYDEETGNYFPSNIGTPELERLTINENTRYEIMVDVPDEELITAVCETKSFGKLGSIDVTLNDINGDENFTLDRLKIELDDPVGENFYFLWVSYFFNVVFEDGSEFRDRRIGFLYNASSILDGEASTFTDELFDGQTKTLEFWSERFTRSRVDLQSGSYEEPDAMAISLYSLTEEEYNFRMSMQNNRNAQNNPFAEPTIVFSNVENGFGIFSLMKLQEVEIKF